MRFRFWSWALALQLGAAGAALNLPGVAAANESCRVAFVGDSLTAGFGLDEADTWPTRMAARMRDAGFDCAVINAGVSGDTTAGGKARIGWVLFDEPSHVVLALGANDGLRGLPVEDMARNLSVMIRDLHAADVHVLLAGMLAPPNMGPAYVERYEAAFRTVAAAHEVAFVPFLLDGIAARPELNQADGIHPNAAGVAVMVERTWPVFEQWLEATLPDA